MRISYGLALLGLLFGGISISSAQPARPDAEDVRIYLSTHPLLIQSNTRVLEVYTQGEALVINLSQEILPNGTYDEMVFQQLEIDLYRELAVDQYYMVTFKVEGLSLEDWGRPLPDFEPIQLTPPAERDTVGPLSGYRIALNAGHGRYWNEEVGEWRWQRVLFWDIREDLINADIIRLVSWSLINHGATVIDEREQDINARIGESGLPAWQEAARHFAIYEGLPASVWNGAVAPYDTNYNDDIRARPYIANYFDADLMISLHNNGLDGSLSGTETYYDISGDYTNPQQNYALADAVHNSIINTIRNKYYSGWVNRGIKASDAGYGEIHYTEMPSILIELAFMDHQYPDNMFLQDSRFRVFTAEAIVDGICSYLGVNCGDIPISSPRYIETPTFSPEASGDVCASGWQTFTNQRGQTAALTPNANIGVPASQSAVWQSFIPYDGMYHVEAFIPAYDQLAWTCPPLTLESATGNAHYRVSHAFGTSSAWADQSIATNSWVDLGVYYFKKAEGATVSLDNLTLEEPQTRWVAFSAMRLNLVGYGAPEFSIYIPLVLNTE